MYAKTTHHNYPYLISFMSDFAPFVAAALRDKSMQDLLEENRREYSYMFAMWLYDMIIYDSWYDMSTWYDHDLFILWYDRMSSYGMLNEI